MLLVVVNETSLRFILKKMPSCFCQHVCASYCSELNSGFNKVQVKKQWNKSQS